MSRPCPTPYKGRFPSVQDAEFQRTADGIRYGTPLYTYQCTCGAWHLTSDDKRDLPAYEPPDTAVVAHLRALPMTQFIDVVDADAKARAPLAERLALRHPDLLTRWHHALKALRLDINRQLTNHAASPEWRTRAEGYRDVLTGLLTECQTHRAHKTRTRAA
ncbi:hypothetical protein [Streptomyces sp. DH12]|uniref:hypothetical protein n=1 Tax=Streptomyces sp. DH12 TaxID=2857010 RepID=UPI00226C5277|nr:hypothetical protein [Streptomyces sp. DH12]